MVWNWRAFIEKKVPEEYFLKLIEEDSYAAAN